MVDLLRCRVFSNLNLIAGTSPSCDVCT